MNTKIKAIIFALSAALFYAVNVPLSKILLREIEPSFMAALLYLGAGTGMLILSLLKLNIEENSEPFTGDDMPFVAGLIVLDIAAPIFLMMGIRYGTSSNASLLGNFEIVATALIAFVFFREPVSKTLQLAILLITVSGILLTFEGSDSLRFSYGSIFVLTAATFWGLENNCTRKLSSKSAAKIVILKGILSGIGSMLIALVQGENGSAFHGFRECNGAWICCLRTEHIFLREGSGNFRCCEDERVLCGCTVRRSIDVVRAAS